MFKDRVDAGKKLAEKLIKYSDQNTVVLALPRGGVPVGFEVAKRLKAPLDVLVVRKLGAPSSLEFGIGAIAPNNIKVIDEISVEKLGISRKDIEKIEKKLRKELDRRIKKYRGKNSFPDVKNKTVVLVDDGVATGVSAKAAIKAVLEQNPKRLIIAVPVCALNALKGISSVVRPIKDEVICLYTPYDFSAVGHFYKSFNPVSDQEVIKLLQSNKVSLLKQSQRKIKRGKQLKVWAV
ncbi:phosphoribosyltransferase [Candidatus Daviesbacteria bacterium]|nr:phosphoribosyltransferase [Candidatus Daviesbacteria bacterium]